MVVALVVDWFMIGAYDGTKIESIIETIMCLSIDQSIKPLLLPPSSADNPYPTFL